MKTGRLTAFVVATVLATPSWAAEFYEPLSRSGIGRKFRGKSISLDGNSSLVFKGGEVLRFYGILGMNGKGYWHHDEDSVWGEYEYMTICRDDDGCEPEPATGDVNLVEVWASKKHIVCDQMHNGGEHIETIRLECDDDNNCYPGGEFVSVIHASPSRALYDVFKQKVKEGKRWGVTFFEAKPSKNHRKTSEIWYTTEHEGDNEEAAKRLAKKLEPILGTLTPKEWTFNVSPYNILLVVGAAKVGAAPMPKVQLMDGGCTAKAASGCTNPAVDELTSALQGAGYTLAKSKPAKSARTAMEVWFKKGHREAAEALIAKHLKGRIDKSAIKEWTWGGDFDLVVVVPPK